MNRFLEVKNNDNLLFQNQLNLLKESDDIANNTSWKYLVNNGEKKKNFKVKIDKIKNQLKIVPTFYRIRETFQVLLVSIAFLIIEFIKMKKESETSIEITYIGSTILIILLFKFVYVCLKSFIFNIDCGVFYESFFGEEKSNIDSKEDMLIKNIHAIQLISKIAFDDRIRFLKEEFYSYEINLVLKDGSRVNIIDHGNLDSILEDSKLLSEFLNIPLWNVMKYTLD